MALVIVGNGMASARLCERLAEGGWTSRERTLVLGEEPLPAYDRVHLSDLFATDKSVDELVLRPARWYREVGIELHTGKRVARIDREQQRLWTSSGSELEYERLVIATGSEPVLPDVQGLAGSRVGVYRTARDREAIARVAEPGSRIAILGGGLLGIELAAALSRRGARPVIIERAPRLLPRHLEDTAAGLLAEAVRKRGVELRCGEELAAAQCSETIAELQLRSGSALAADFVVVTIGVRPRDALAREAGLLCDRRGGICVDDQLQTSDASIYAVGECAVHRGERHGLVAPGRAMADALAQSLQGTPTAFSGVAFATRLKLEGIDISVLGESASGDVGTQALTAVRGENYRRVLLREGRLIGAAVIGEWDALPRIQEGIARAERVRPPRRRRFERTGELWRDSTARPIARWPDAATVCSCTGVTCGALRHALAQGHTSTEQLARHTGASSVCGSCRPLVAELCGERVAPARTRARALGITSALAAAAALAIALLRPIPLLDTAQVDFAWDQLWRSDFARQVTGYAALTAAATTLLLSLRKRWRRLSLGSYPSWRVAHACLGVLALLLAGLHTGLHLGDHMNLALMVSFLSLSALGAGAGAVTALERRLEPPLGGKLRRGWTLAHLIALSPFTVLLGFHVLKFYYF